MKILKFNKSFNCFTTLSTMQLFFYKLKVQLQILGSYAHIYLYLIPRVYIRDINKWMKKDNNWIMFMCVAICILFLASYIYYVSQHTFLLSANN